MTENTTHRNILENMREGVMSLDLKGRITTFNPAAEAILRLDRSAVVGRFIAEVFLHMEGGDELMQTVLDAIYDSTPATTRTATAMCGFTSVSRDSANWKGVRRFA